MYRYPCLWSFNTASVKTCMDNWHVYLPKAFKSACVLNVCGAQSILEISKFLDKNSVKIPTKHNRRKMRV